MPDSASSNLFTKLRSLSRLEAKPIRSADARPSHSLDRTHQLREAALLVFCEPLSAECGRLWHLNKREWKELLNWLDTSGLALYFFDRITELGQCEMFPPSVLTRLQQNVGDNTARMNAMLAELTTIHLEFQSAGLSYALLKGFSLWPVSVPRPELRSQLDLDFLIAEQSLPRARQILEANGYHLHAVSGRSWEFKANEGHAGSIGDLYKVTPARTLELHVETSALGQPSLLARSDRRSFQGVDMPVLSPADLFLGQGLHLYKHVASEFFRVAHLIEFRRHIIARYHDAVFWKELQELGEANACTSIGLGVVTLLISQVMGCFAPEALTCWTVDRLPAAAKLWISMYGLGAVLASCPGTKLYLLLEKELTSAGLPEKRSLWQQLIPRRLPPAIAHAAMRESVPMRIHRHRKQLQYVLFRLRFHAVQNSIYIRESARWRRSMNRLEASEAFQERVGKGRK